MVQSLVHLSTLLVACSSICAELIQPWSEAVASTRGLLGTASPVYVHVDDPAIRYVGRFLEFSDVRAFSWPGVQISTLVTGAPTICANVTAGEWGDRYLVTIDGEETGTFWLQPGENNWWCWQVYEDVHQGLSYEYEYGVTDDTLTDDAAAQESHLVTLWKVSEDATIQHLDDDDDDDDDGDNDDDDDDGGGGTSSKEQNDHPRGRRRSRRAVSASRTST